MPEHPAEVLLWSLAFVFLNAKEQEKEQNNLLQILVAQGHFSCGEEPADWLRLPSLAGPTTRCAKGMARGVIFTLATLGAHYPKLSVNSCSLCRAPHQLEVQGFCGVFLSPTYWLYLLILCMYANIIFSRTFLAKCKWQQPLGCSITRFLTGHAMC